MNELKISKFLRYGVFGSGIVMLTGWTLSLLMAHRQWSENPFEKFSVYQTEPLPMQLHQAWSQQNVSILISYLGLSILIALPIIRVFLTMVLFFKNRERTLGSVALFVFLILIVSLVLGVEL